METNKNMGPTPIYIMTKMCASHVGIIVELKSLETFIACNSYFKFNLTCISIRRPTFYSTFLSHIL